MAFTRITIIKNSKPKTRTINEELQWFGQSLGLFGKRDKDKSCFRIFIVLIKQASKDSGLSSDEISFRLNLTRGTVVHHLNKLMDSGIVINRRGKYFLSVNTLEELVSSMKKNAESFFEELENVAKAIDERMKF